MVLRLSKGSGTGGTSALDVIAAPLLWTELRLLPVVGRACFSVAPGMDPAPEEAAPPTEERSTDVFAVWRETGRPVLWNGLEEASEMVMVSEADVMDQLRKDDVRIGMCSVMSSSRVLPGRIDDTRLRVRPYG